MRSGYLLEVGVDLLAGVDCDCFEFGLFESVHAGCLG